MTDWADELAFFLVSADGVANRAEAAGMFRKAKASGMREAAQYFWGVSFMPEATDEELVKLFTDRLSNHTT